MSTSQNANTDAISREISLLGAEIRKLQTSGKEVPEDMSRRMLKLTVKDGVDVDALYKALRDDRLSTEVSLSENFNRARLAESLVAIMPEPTPEEAARSQTLSRTGRNSALQNLALLLKAPK